MAGVIQEGMKMVIYRILTMEQRKSKKECNCKPSKRSRNIPKRASREKRMHVPINLIIEIDLSER